MSAAPKAAELIPQPWRDDLIEAGQRKDLAEIDAIRADLAKRFPDLFRAVNE